MCAAKQACGKANAIGRLQDMGLDQIAEWVKFLPEDQWGRLFLDRWPTLAKKCGVIEEFHLHML